MDDALIMLHMLYMIADANDILHSKVVATPSGRFLPGDAVQDFLFSLEEALALQSEISPELHERYRSLPEPDQKNLN